ncbi:response regulator, partial [Alphaproteobacteria bacterium]|nr:response regulator [Alphaproteobacteria bacterium]
REAALNLMHLNKSQSMLNNVFDGIITLKNDGAIESVNSSAKDIIFGIEKKNIKNIFELISNANRQDFFSSKNIGVLREFREVTTSGEEFYLEIVLNNLDDSWTLFDRRQTKRKLYVATLRDVTKSKKMAIDLEISRKMDALGTLAGGIAHDFNNILSIIFGYASQIDQDKQLNIQHKDSLEAIMQASRRARDLVKQIMSFSEPAGQEKELINISSLITEVSEFIRRTIPSRIKINLKVENRSILVFGNSAALHGVIVNLCTNSSHAIGENVGEISIQINDKKLNKENLDEGLVKITISDTGHGIDQSLKNKVFDPFFTTKQKGDGNGLGLSVVKGVISDHNGFIKLNNEFKDGAEFIIELPIANSRDFKDTKKKLLNKENKDYHNIIVVDDEKLIVEVNKKILASMGHNVIGFSDSNKALELFKNNPNYYSIIITDQNMPGLTGDMLVKEIRKISNSVAIILCTGYSDAIDKNEAKNIGVNAFVSKPLERHELENIVGNISNNMKTFVD